MPLLPRNSASPDGGAVAAEFVIVTPAVLLVLGAVIGGLMLAAQQVSFISAAGEVARLEARGDGALAEARINALPPRVTVTRTTHQGILCVTLNGTPGSGALSVFRIQGSGCAAMIKQ